MKKLIVMLAILAGGYQLWNQIEQKHSIAPLYDEAYVAVYGRNSCGWTRSILRDLQAANINYKYFIVDDTQVADVLHSRMEASGISIRRYNLPVVDVSGRLSVRPDFQQVSQDYYLSYHSKISR